MKRIIAAHRTMRWIIFLLCTTLLACTGRVRMAPPPALVTPTQAQALSDQGEFSAAAKAWLAAAQKLQDPALARQYRLHAADAFLMAHDPAGVRRALSGAGGEGAAPGDLTRIDMRLAAAALMESYTQRALALLTVPERSVPEDEAARFRRLRATALEANDEPFAAARDWMVVARVDPDHGAAAAQNVLRLLNSLPLGVLQQLNDRYQHIEDLHLWLQFALDSRDAMLRGENVAAAMARFVRQHPDHPASRWLAPMPQQSFPDRVVRPDHIAVLLPLTGRFSPAARALRNALIAAYFETSDSKPDLRIYDTSADSADINTLYDHAVSAGAEYVIGPLERGAVETLRAGAERTVPVLALNDSPTNALPTPQTVSAMNAPFYQFSLNPEQGARQAAQLARSMGKRRAVVLVAENTWGQRLQRAFTTTFVAQGGEVSDRYRYDPRAHDYGQVVQRLMGVNASKSRYRRIHRLTGGKLAFETTPRDDIDMIFIAARPKAGRALRPLLNFYQATELAVYASAEIYSGIPQPALDNDLNGVYFCDAPWLLGISGNADPAATLNAFPDGDQFIRLYALGLDAYRVLSYLPWLQAHPLDRFPGLTGDLQVTHDGSVRRTLRCARFADGKPSPVPLPAQLSLTGTTPP